MEFAVIRSIAEIASLRLLYKISLLGKIYYDLVKKRLRECRWKARRYAHFLTMRIKFERPPRYAYWGTRPVMAKLGPESYLIDIEDVFGEDFLSDWLIEIGRINILIRSPAELQVEAVWGKCSLEHTIKASEFERAHDELYWAEISLSPANCFIGNGYTWRTLVDTVKVRGAEPLKVIVTYWVFARDD